MEKAEVTIDVVNLPLFHSLVSALRVNFDAHNQEEVCDCSYCVSVKAWIEEWGVEP